MSKIWKYVTQEQEEKYEGLNREYHEKNIKKSYYIKIHFLEDPEYFESEDYDWKDILATSYNEALTLLWKEEEVFFDKIIDEYTEKWVEYETNEKFDEVFEILWNKDLDWNWNCYKIVIINFIWINSNEIDKFKEYFFSDLKDKTNFIWKFEDSRFLEIRKIFFEEVFKIEIDLREVISFIFFNTYFTSLDLLKDLQVNTIKKDLKSEELFKNLENEFFYISFSDYKKLLNLKNLKDDEKTKLLEASKSFNEWKNKIFNRWIQRKFYIDFISSIEQDLAILENFRNAIMHNRCFSQNLKENYDKSKNEIIKKINNFKESYMYLEWNDLDLIIWNKYTYIAETTDNFIQWVKYELLEIIWWDTIFMWEHKKNNIPFFDKEFSLYWKWE